MFKKMVLLIFGLLITTTLLSCSPEEDVVNIQDNSKSYIENTKNKVTILTNNNKDIIIPDADSSKAVDLMNKIYIEGSISANGHKVYLSDVQEYFPVFQLRAIELKGSMSYIKFYSINKLYDELRLFTFYGKDEHGDYEAVHSMIINKNLSVDDFKVLELGKSVIDDVEKIDSATQLSFYNSEDELNRNDYVKFVDICWSERDFDYFSAHVTKDGVVNIVYRKENNIFVVNKIYTDKDYDIIKSINRIDLK